MADYSLLLSNIKDFLYNDDNQQYPGKGAVFYTRWLGKGEISPEKKRLKELIYKSLGENGMPFLNNPDYREFLNDYDSGENISSKSDRLGVDQLIFIGVHLGGWRPLSGWATKSKNRWDTGTLSALFNDTARQGKDELRNEFIKSLNDWGTSPSDNDDQVSYSVFDKRLSSQDYKPMTEYIVFRNYELIRDHCPEARRDHLKEVIKGFYINMWQAEGKRKDGGLSSLYSEKEEKKPIVTRLCKNLKTITETYENAKTPDDDRNWLAARALTWLVIGALLRDKLTINMISNNLEPYLTDALRDMRKKRKNDIPVEDGLYDSLAERFRFIRDQHPSIRLMKPDPRLFPKGLPTINSSQRTAKEGDIEPSTVQEMVLKSWQDPKEKKHILLVGEGGIGKTVCMLTLPTEEWFCEYRIPVIYIPLQRLDAHDGKLNDYINVNYKNEIDGINSLAALLWEGHPNLILLLDGFNEIPMEHRMTAERHIRAWMDKPGVQVITTSRINAFLNSRFREYALQPLPYDICRNYLLSSGISKEDLPGEGDGIWKVINMPLMLTMFTQIDTVKENTKNLSEGLSDYLVWKKPDNAAHIIWDYLQLELYRLADTDESPVVLKAAAILAAAPFVCFEMAKGGRFYAGQEDFQELLRKAARYYAKDQKAVPRQVRNIRNSKWNPERVNPFGENSWEEYFDILTGKSVLFQERRSTDSDGELEIVYVPAHQNFRDALAAVFVSGCMLNSVKEGLLLPEVVLTAADFNEKNYISEYLSEEELEIIWNYHRLNDPKNGRITWILLDLIGRKRDYDFRELDFSSLDLTGINLHRLLSKRVDICPLPERVELLNNTKLSLKNLLPETHESRIHCMSYSPNGMNLACGLEDGGILILDFETGGTNRMLKGHASGVTSVSYSPDGNNLASASYDWNDCSVRIWNVKDGSYQTLEGYSEVIYSISYSTDGRYLATGSFCLPAWATSVPSWTSWRRAPACGGNAWAW